jgi:hypothetical protein
LEARVSASPAVSSASMVFGEGRLGGIGGDGRDLGLVGGERAREGRQEMLRRDWPKGGTPKGPDQSSNNGLALAAWAAAAWLC